MFQSFSRNNQNQKLQLQCNKCKQKPDHQFVLLLCDHVICGACLDDYVELRENQYEGIRCPCGVVSYFKPIDGPETDSDFRHPQAKRSSNISVNIHSTSVHRQERGSKRISNRPSIGLIQSKNTTSTKNLSRIQTETVGLNQSGGYEAPDQIYDKLMLQRSKYPVRNTHDGTHAGDSPPTGMRSPVSVQSDAHHKFQSTNNLHFCPKFIDSESVTEDQGSFKQNCSPNGSNNRRPGFKHQYERQQSNCSDSSPEFNQASLSPIHSRANSKPNTHKKKKRNQIPEPSELSSELRSQLNYLKLTHKKNLEALQRAYKLAKEKINHDYIKLENNIKGFCLETLALSHENSQVNFGKIISMKYSTSVENNLCRLTQEIKKYAVGNTSFTFSQYGGPSQNRSKVIGDGVVDREVQPTRPSAYGSEHLQTEPSTIYGSHLPTKYGNYPGLRQNLEKYSQISRQANQGGSRLQKKGTRRKTNIIIQL